MDYLVTEGVSPSFVRLVKEGVKSVEKKSVEKCCNATMLQCYNELMF